MPKKQKYSLSVTQTHTHARIHTVIGGGWNNSRTIIRKRHSYSLREILTPNVLSHQQPIEFEITITRRK